MFFATYQGVKGFIKIRFVIGLGFQNSKGTIAARISIASPPRN